MGDNLATTPSPGRGMLKLPPPIWALIYLAIAGLASVAYPWRQIVDLRSLIPGIVLLALGLFVSFSAAMLFNREGTELNPVSETNKKLVIRGPFRITRNPMYLGLVLFTLGIALLAGSLPLFLVPVLAFATANWVHIPFEEAKMRRQFGTDFDAYTAKVRRWI
jgi:protein-S-isoprenylcysteine O-methyltransferase Ste14